MTEKREEEERVIVGGWKKCRHRFIYNNDNDVTPSLERNQKKDEFHYTFNINRR